MSELKDSVILPREDFLELQAETYRPNPTTRKDRMEATAQTFAFCAIVAAAVTAGSFGWAKAMEWRESKTFAREMRRIEMGRIPANKK